LRARTMLAAVAEGAAKAIAADLGLAGGRGPDARLHPQHAIGGLFLWPIALSSDFPSPMEEHNQYTLKWYRYKRHLPDFCHGLSGFMPATMCLSRTSYI